MYFYESDSDRSEQLQYVAFLCKIDKAVLRTFFVSGKLLILEFIHLLTLWLQLPQNL